MARYSYNAPPVDIPHNSKIRDLEKEKDKLQQRIKDINEELTSLKYRCDHTYFMYHKDPETGMMGLAKYICSKCGDKTIRDIS